MVRVKVRVKVRVRARVRVSMRSRFESMLVLWWTGAEVTVSKVECKRDLYVKRIDYNSQEKQALRHANSKSSLRSHHLTCDNYY